MRIRRSATVLALAVLGLVAVSSSPALADHQFVHGYWSSGSFPGVANSFYSTPDGVIQDSAYFWQDNGFTGYTPPLPGGSWEDCGVHEGWINICTLPRSQMPGGVDGNFYGEKNPYTNQKVNARILIASDLDNAARQRVLRQEFGHAIGLGHQGGDGGNNNCSPPPSGYSDTVMRCDAPTPYINGHDSYALFLMY